MKVSVQQQFIVEGGGWEWQDVLVLLLKAGGLHISLQREDWILHICIMSKVSLYLKILDVC